MAFIIPDEILEELTCSVCKKYLSVKPIKVYTGGIIKCGRCSKSEDDGVVSLFGNIAENGLFRCVNRYEGCKRYLTYLEVSDHENECPSENYHCPICPASSYRPASAYLLFLHYKTCHKDDILTQAEFFIDINNECDKNFLYCKNDNIYIIYINRHSNEEYLLLNAFSVSFKEIFNKVTQKFRLYTLDKEPLYETKKQCCSSFDDNSNAFRIPLSKLINKQSSFVICNLDFDTSELNNFIFLPNGLITTSTGYATNSNTNATKGLHNTYPKIYASKDFHMLFPEYSLSTCKTNIFQIINNVRVEFPRICSFCENIFQNSGELSDIHKCANNHFVCQSCFNVNEYCCEGKYFYAEKETEIYNLLFFYCKYECNRFYCGRDLRYHETHCKKNNDIFCSQEDIGKKHFGNSYSLTSNCLTTNTNVFLLETIISQNISKIYVITRDNFNFTLHCLKDKNNLRFWFTHDYPHDKYYILVRIKERHIAYYNRVNCFTLDINNKNILFFSVVLRTL